MSCIHPNLQRLQVTAEARHHASDTKGNFMFERIIRLDRSHFVLDLRHKR